MFSTSTGPMFAFAEHQEKQYGKRVDEILDTENEFCRCYRMLFVDGLLEKYNKLDVKPVIYFDDVPMLKKHMRVEDDAISIEPHFSWHADIRARSKNRRAKLLWVKLLRHVYKCKQCQSELPEDLRIYLLVSYCKQVVTRYFNKHNNDELERKIVECKS